MQNKSLAEQLKAPWARMNSLESLALAKGVRASSGMPKVTIQPTLPNHGRVMVFEEVFDVPRADNAASENKRTSAENAPGTLQPRPKNRGRGSRRVAVFASK